MNAFSKRDEERLIEAGREYYATAFPNPERVGCPDGTAMQALVHGQLGRVTRQQIDSHMMQCSPCFNDYVRLREAGEKSARWRRLAAVAALIALVVASWIVTRYLEEQVQMRQPSTRESRNVTYQADLLDLRNKAALRGAEENRNEAAAVLPPATLGLSIYLPTGSEPGAYEVQVTRGPGQPLLKAHGQARMRDHIAVLELKLDLQELQPGLYLLWIRQVGSSWSYYPVLVRAST
jgi:hypothetical protein